MYIIIEKRALTGFVFLCSSGVFLRLPLCYTVGTLKIARKRFFSFPTQNMADKVFELQTSVPSANFRIDYPNELNDTQWGVVRDGEGPCLVLAGAGSGKTRTLVYRVAYLLERGVRPDRILLVTFTNKAAREMMQRVEALIGSQPRGLWGGTFHSVSNRVLRQYAKALGYTNDFGILDSDDSKKLLVQIYKELGIRKDKYFPKSSLMHTIISFAKNSQRTISDVVTQNYDYLQSDILPMLENVAALYEEKKRESNVMDFDDLLINWLRLLRDVPEIGRPFAEQFDYVLVDEFQDTNIVQAELVRHLSQPQNNVLVVGDDAQSIYSFRAATVDNILTFQQLYPNARVFKLQKNYRSTPQILQLANESIRQNQFQYDKQLESYAKPGDKPALIPARDQQQQAEIIAQRVLELRNKGVSLEEMAVLFRSSYQIIELELQLGRRGIPYQVRGGLRFFEQAHIKDVLAHLKIMQNAKDEVSWRRVLGLHDGIGPGTSTKIWARLKEHDMLAPMMETLRDLPASGRVRASLEKLHRSLLGLYDKQGQVSEAIRHVLEQGYQVYLEKSFDDPKERWEDLQQLAIFSSQYKDLGEFLAEASLSEGFKVEVGREKDNGPTERLVLSTIHQAKGLEWEAVFCLGLADGQFPHYRVADKPREMEEERRLFYVVVTRAKRHLHLVYPIMSRSAASGQVINRPSIFLREVDENLFETWQVNETPYGNKLAFKAVGAADHNEQTDTVYISEDEEYEQEQKKQKGKGSILDIMRGI